MRAGYWLAAALAVIGLVVAGMWTVFAFSAYVDHIDHFARSDVPGQTTVSIGQPGMQVVYYEYPRGTAPPDITVTITDPDGNPVALKQVGYELIYDVPGRNGRAGKAVLEFRAETAGRYVLSVAGDAPATRIAVGDNIVGYMLPTVLGVIAVVVVTWGAALTLVIVTAVSRARVARQPAPPPAPVVV